MLKTRTESKIHSQDQLRAYIAHIRGTYVDIVLTTGVFDLPHDGHVCYLEDAAEQGMVLIVGVDSDQRVKIQKGPTRPILPERVRARVVAAYAAVDRVVIYDDFDELAALVKPNVIIASPTYTEDPELTRFAFARSQGAQVKLIDSRSTVHTTDIIATILNRAK